MKNKVYLFLKYFYIYLSLLLLKYSNPSFISYQIFYLIRYFIFFANLILHSKKKEK